MTDLNQTQNFQVYIRIRPIKQSNVYIRTNNEEIFVASNVHEKKQKKYQFTQVFSDQHKNQYIWENSMKQQISICKNGYNLTLLAYGVTGSGKTHTIFGNEEQQGLALKCFNELLNSNSQCQFKFSYIQIYNQCVRDLLSDHENKNLNIIQQNSKTIIPELKQFPIKEYYQIKELIDIGNQKRALAATNINQVSSRSHAILQFTVIKKVQKQILTSKLTIIDLAGSQKTFYNESNKMIIQGSNINKSLLALGNCINALSNNSNCKNSFIPYRDSKLTRILKEALSGNSRSVMFACISPNPLQYEQTLNTIYYASRAYKIKKRLKKNSVKNSFVVCPNCNHQIPINHKQQDLKKQDKIPKLFQKNESQNKLSEKYDKFLIQTIQKMDLIDIDSIKTKLNEVIEQSQLIGKRSQLNYIYDSSILKEVFQINKKQLAEQLEKIENIFKTLSHFKTSEQYYQNTKENLNVNIKSFQKRKSLDEKINHSVRSFRQSQKRTMEDQRTTYRKQVPKEIEITLRMKRDFDEFQQSPQNPTSKKQLIRKKIASAKQYLIPSTIPKNLRIL